MHRDTAGTDESEDPPAYCLCVIGTRPEAIKMAPVIRALRSCRGLRPVVCSTGQHREMLDQVLPLFEIVPDFDLGVMEADQQLVDLTARLLLGIGTIIDRVQPACVLAQGDTTSVLASALVSYYRRIPFGHVEAGLRTGDRWQPFPEEMNRCVADTLAEWLFAPTERSRQNLLREGYPDQRITVTGNTVIDAMHYVAALPYDWSSGPLAHLADHQSLVLVTAHRRESFGEPFREMCEAIRELARRFEAGGVHFVYPVHPNPNVRQPVSEILAGIPNLTLLEPLDYRTFVHIMKRAMLILTDSGGIQEEAPALGVPVLVMRGKTERPEGVETGVVKVTGAARESIVREASRLLSNRIALAEMARSVNPYGDGRAAERIVAHLLSTHREHANGKAPTTEPNHLGTLKSL